MAKNKRRFLDFYNECIQSESIRAKQLPHSGSTGGLCSTWVGETLEFGMIRDYADGMGWWGHSEQDNSEQLELHKSDPNDIMYRFTPLRQNIVLLCAAMNGEL